MLNSHQLISFIDGFFGYGNLRSELWFVGMEEGGGNSEREIAARLQAWHDRNRPVVDDAAAFHNAAGLLQEPDDPCHLSNVFAAHGRLQGTWEGLIRLLFAARGQESDVEQMRQYQIQRLGRANACHALLELLPLPSPNVDTWNYPDWSDLPFLRTRGSYSLTIKKWRLAKLKLLIKTHQPAVVVLYGRTLIPDWSHLADFDFRREENGGILLPGTRPTHYVLLPHFQHRDVPPIEQYTQAGLQIQSLLHELGLDLTDPA